MFPPHSQLLEDKMILHLSFNNSGYWIKSQPFNRCNIFTDTDTTDQQNTAYFNARVLSPFCSDIPCKGKCQDSMGHRESAGSTHLPASNAKCFPASFSQHPGPVKSHVLEAVLLQPALLSHSQWIHFPQWIMKTQNLQTTILQIFNSLKPF